MPSKQGWGIIYNTSGAPPGCVLAWVDAKMKIHLHEQYPNIEELLAKEGPVTGTWAAHLGTLVRRMVSREKRAVYKEVKSNRMEGFQGSMALREGGRSGKERKKQW